MNRATIALVGSAFLIALGVLRLQEAWDAIDATTIVFLLSMMVVNANLSFAGFFLRALSVLLSFTRSPLGLLIAFTVGLPLAVSALVAASLLLITRRIKPQRILKEVDWNLLVMFSGLFILTKATQKLNLLQPFTYAVNSSAGLVSVTAILSNLISNVPAVLLLQPLIPKDDTQSWLLLAAGSTLAGNLTLFGSVANLIVVEAATELGYKLTFWEHLRFGLPLTVLTLLLLYLWIH